MRTTNLAIMIGIVFLLSFSLISAQITGAAIIVDADYITIYPGEEGKIDVEIENTDNIDIEDVSVSLILDELPFSAVGSSKKEIDDIKDDDEESVTFSIKASTDANPGDYNIPYIVQYNKEGEEKRLEKTGSFGIRISAKTEIDFAVETKGDNTDFPIVGQKGKISLEVINKGLGDLRSLSVQVFPQGFELISKDTIFVGTVNAEDSDIVTFDVVFNIKNPILSAQVTYKDFDNNLQTETVDIPMEIYTMEEALKLGIIQKSYTWVYIVVIVVLIIAWIVYRKIRKRMKNKKKSSGR